MPLNLSVQAAIIDIRNDTPRQEDIFLVDTNVWLWQTYSNASFSAPNAARKIQAYTLYLRKARQNGSTLVYSGLILSELAHVIEKTELEIYNRQENSELKTKEYRHNYPTERAKVVAEVEAAWKQVESLAIPIDLKVDEATTNATLARFKIQALDGYDLLILEAIQQAEPGQVNVITDDGDYAVVPGIQVFTCNGTVIQQATAQGKLVRR